MFEVTYTIDGIQKTMTISAKDYEQTRQVLENMYSGGKVEIINIVRK